MRLREVGPTTLAEADKIAVRMEAHRIADKQRTRLVGKVEQDSQNIPSSTVFIRLYDGGFLFQNNFKNLDLSYKTDLDICDCFERENSIS
ncbi:MAG: hypothetical protein AB2693_22555 [Candidatus Thiodiazotropha sp.]